MESKLNWAHAIFEIAKEEKKLILYKENFHALLDVEVLSQIKLFLSNELIGLQKKKSILIEIFGDKEKLFLNSILLLVQEKQIYYFENILNEIINLINKELKITTAIVWTTTYLDKALIKRIDSIIEKKFSKNFNTINKIDTEMIGGIKIQIDDKLIDYSVKTNLEKLKNQFLENNMVK